MKQTEHIELMHIVLDGEASAEQKQELDRLLAADQGLRGQFEQLSRLFSTLGGAPEVRAPEGLVDLIMAKIPLQQVRREGWRQPFWRSGVIAASSAETRDLNPGIRARVHRVSRPVQFTKELAMSEHKNSFFKSTKGRFLVGTGVAAAAVLTISSVIDQPGNGTATVGTIVPAQRYRAPQNTAEDIKVGNPSGAQSAQINTQAGGAAGSAAGNA
ncbi:MAG: hypothetical protein AAB654_12495, partial [Acidobacteriota bacterium]